MSHCPAASASTRSMRRRCSPCPRYSGEVMTVPSCRARIVSPATVRVSGVTDTLAITSPSDTSERGA